MWLTCGTSRLLRAGTGRESAELTDDVVARALAKDPDERLRTCADFVSGLAGSLGVASPTPAAVVRPAKPKRKRPREPGRLRRRSLVLLGLLALLAAGAAVGVGVALATDTDRPAGSTDHYGVETDAGTARRDARRSTSSWPTSFPPEFGRRASRWSRSAMPSTRPCAARWRPGVPRVEYSHARSGDGLTDYLRARAAAAGIEFDPDDTLEPPCRPAATRSRAPRLPGSRANGSRVDRLADVGHRRGNGAVRDRPHHPWPCSLLPRRGWPLLDGVDRQPQRRLHDRLGAPGEGRHPLVGVLGRPNGLSACQPGRDRGSRTRCDQGRPDPAAR